MLGQKRPSGFNDKASKGFCCDEDFRALGSTGTTRSLRFPDLPTISETIPGFEMVAWVGVVAPAATPSPVISRVHAEFGKFLKLDDTREKMRARGPEPWITTVEAFTAAMRRDFERNGKIVKAVGIRID